MNLESKPANEPKILLQTDDWMIVEKPSGYHSVRGKSVDAPTIEDWLLEKFPILKNLAEAGLVHRLDQKTSGCLFVAKSQNIFEDFQRRFRIGKGIQKIYLALVSGGNFSDARFEFYFSSRYKGSKKVTVSLDGPARERGHCEWKTITTKNDFSLLEVQLHGPGKRHEIRAGLAHLQHPIVGDELYGGISSAIFGLHAWKLSFDGVSVESPRPAGWKALL
ncbi:MAG: RNA pseudouridine synthase [Deltaproteobacteria bacterium]|nr:RNA pseudouridine synthase [Deltaproteobacteria bacterium]